MATAASATVTVVKLTGQAWIRNRDGSLTELHVGARIPVDSEIVTGPGAELELQAQNGMPVIIGAERELLYTGDIEDIPGDASEVKIGQLGDTDAERLIAALQAGQDPFDVVDPTAAISQASGGGDSGGGGNVSRLLYVVETTTPLSLSYPGVGTPAADTITLGDAGGGGTAAAATTPVATTPVATTPSDTTPVATAPATPATTPNATTPTAETPAVTQPTIEIPAANTAPVAINDAFGTTQNAGLTGNVLANDRDADGDTITVVSVNGLIVSNGSVTLAGSNGGSFTVATNGGYTFNPGNAFESLGAGASAITTVSYTITDPSGATSTATLQVTVSGTNDTPVLTTGVTLAGQINTDSDTVNIGVAGQFRDPDSADTLSYSATGLPEGLSINGTTGVISGVLANSASQGGAGGNGVYSIVVTATDGIGANVSQTFNWTVSNPSPIAINDFAVGSETATVQGNLLSNDSDPDGDTIVVTQVAGQALLATGIAVSGSNGGTFTVLANGTYTFAPGNDFRGLVDGESATTQITYVIRDADGATATATLTVTINGANDTAVITPAAPGSDAGTVIEDAADTTVSGKLNVVDPDAGQAVFSAQTATAGVYGSFSIDANGNWTYALNNAATNVQALAAGEQRQETFTVTSADGTTSSVIVTIIGVNDAAVIAGQATGAVIESASVNSQGNLTTTGALTVTDVDTRQAMFRPGTAAPVGSTLGTLSIAENGTWTYNVANSAVQYLAADETKTESFTVAAADGTTTVITVTITGTNDVPTFTGTNAGAVTEDAAVNVDGNLVASGALIANDADAGQSIFKAGTAVPVGSTLGSLSIAENGTWTYNVANSAAQYLGAGETKTESFTVAAADGTTTVITVTITGTNDVPTFTGTNAGAVTEDNAVNVDGNLVSSGALIITDADAGQSTFQVGTAVPVGSTLGALSIAANGTWTYNVANSAVQYLAAGETKTESFTVAAADGTTTVITVTITGTNDVPTFTGTDVGAVTEDAVVNVDGNLVSSGALIVTDADAGQSTFQAGNAVPVGSTLGALSIAANGTWTYNVANSAVQYLAAGETKTESFTVAAADGTTTVITVTITGTNDVPTFIGTNIGAVTEDAAVNVDGNLVSSGALIVTDADAGQSTFQAGTAVPVGSTLGALSIAANGTWTYNVANSAIQYLAAGETKNESFTVAAADGITTVITVTITGTNDVPTFTGTNAGAVTEDAAVNVDGNLVSSGALIVTDADAGQSTFQAGTAVPVGSTLGSLSIAANGTWTYNVANSAIQYLAAGETKNESFTVAAADGTTTVITVTITGTNDVPTFTGVNAGAVTEDAAVNVDGNLVSSGALIVTDADAGQSTFQAGTAVPVGSTLGSLSIAANGTWTYNVANSAIQYLAASETKNESFTVAAADGITTVITVTITGTNDVPTFTGTDVGAVTEDLAVNVNGNLISSGALIITDADAGQSTFQAGTAVPVGSTLGSLSIAANGTWTYNVANSAVQYLAAGETKAESFTVAAADGTTTVITVTITGTNDVPTFTGTNAGAVTEDSAVNVDGNLVASGALIASDADAGQSTFKAGNAVPVGSTLGLLSIAENGTWTYNVANSAVQYLAAGETKSESFTVAAADGTTTVITVTITGTNDVPTFTGTNVGAVTEDAAVNVNGNLVSSGALIVTDADAGQSTFKAGTAVPVGTTLGSLSIAENGTWTYNVANSAVQYLAAGETKTEAFTVAAADGTTTVITVTITGTNDVPTFTGTDVGAVTEDAAVSVDGNLVSSGALIVTDADAGQSTFQAGTAVPVGSTLGSLAIAANGTWTYNVANSAVQYLAAGETKTESFTVAAADGTTTVITVTITGTNDVPTFTGTDIGAVMEDNAVNVDGNLVSSGALIVTDADAGQSTFQAGTAVPVGTTLGSLSIAENGTWTYNVANSAVQYLAAGETKTEAFTVAAADGTTTVITVTITGTNDVPTFTGVNAGAVTEDNAVNVDGNLVSSGALIVADADAGQSTFQAGTAVPVGSTLGSLAIAANGTWTYNVANSAVQYLAAGETKTESFTVAAADGTTTVITVTITGTNDVPTFTGTDIGAVMEDNAVNVDGNLVASGALIVTDADAGQSTFQAGTAVPVGSTLGALSIAANGTWTFNVANSAVQYLAAGETKTEAFTVAAADGTTTVVTVTITGTNDVPTFTGVNAGAVTEDNAVSVDGNLVASGALIVTDADAGQSTFQAGTAVPVGSTLGALSIAANGTWTFNVANSAVQYLAAGETKTESFTVAAADGTTTVITVTITGTNDVPTFTGTNAGAVTEDAAVNVDGNLVASGAVIASDADAGQNTFKPGNAVPVGSTLGLLSIAENGTWTYNVANSAVQYLGAGETKTESFTVAAADGTTTVITVTITGTNDVPTFTGTNAGAVTEDLAVNVDGNLVSSGALIVADADAGQSTFQAGTAVPVGSTLGSLAIAANGTWTYNVANSAVQYLAAGETKAESFTVAAADGTTTVITVTITGTNDVPTFTGTNAGAVTEDAAVNVDGNLVSSGALIVIDADAGQSTFQAGAAVPVGSTLGSLAIAANGTWTYNVANSAVQYLAAGETKTESFTVAAADGTTTVISVTITGTNDVPTFTGSNAGAVTEDNAVNVDGNLVSSGALVVADADAGQSTFQAGTAVPVGTTLGSLSIAANGTWTYNVSNSAVQYLAAGETKTEAFTVAAADGTTTVITVTITGTNDVPTFTGTNAGAVTEDSAVNVNGNLISSGALIITDADAGQSTFQAGTAVPVGSTLGALSIAANGSWTYNVANSAVQYLAADETKIESFTVAAADGTTTVVTVTITGTNDVPTFTGVNVGAVTEDNAVNVDGNLVSSGALIVTDADAGQSTFQAGTALPVGTTLGSLSIAANGAWTYNVANSAIQYLAAGETKTESFTVAAADGTTTVITVTITGTNDVPTLSGVNAGAVTEDNAVNVDGNLISSGALIITDADAGQSTFQAGTAVPVGSTLGALSIAENGTWTYNVANSAVQYLAADETKTESFTVAAADGTTTVITVTITGTKDVPTFTGTNSGAVTEDAAVNVDGDLVSSGALIVTDADAGQSIFNAGIAVPVGSTLGSLSIAANGTWTYNVANSAVQYLAAGETKTESFTVAAADGTTTLITVTITGMNDVPTFTGTNAGAVTEDNAVNVDGNLVSSGALVVADADAGQSTFQAGTAVPVGSTLGALSIAANGAWTYSVANSAVQYLAAGDTKTESFTVAAADGTTTVITVTITGTNDVPTFTGTNAGAVTEDNAVNVDGNLVSSGALIVTDADAGQSTFQAGAGVPIGSTLGALSIAANGIWTYNVANNAVQYLAAGETKTESFTVAAADGTMTVITVTITGTNDVPTFTGTDVGAVTEDAVVNVDGNLVSSGALIVTDADAGQSTFQAGTAVPVGSTLGTLSIAANGTWTYNVANSAVQYLAAGETKIESFTVAAVDGTTTVVTITITGTNDVPTFTGTNVGAVTEDAAVNVDGNLVSSGALIITDADAGQSTFQAGTAVPVGSTLGSLAIAANGTWTYNVANSAVQYLAAGETKTESFTVAAADGTTTVITVTITGTNDVPTFTGTNAGAVTEDSAVNVDGNLVSSGALIVTDADAGQSTFQAGNAVPVGSTLGALSIAANGTWTYNVANSAVQYLAASETKTESFTVAAADGTTTVITVTITGTNDVPTFTGLNAGAVTEDNAVNVDGNLVSSGALIVTDADAGQSTFQAGTAVPVGSTLGSLSIAANGSWTYNVANSAVQYLAAGETKTESFTVAAADGTTTVITVTITGTNDLPFFTGTNAGAVTEDAAVNVDGNLISSGALIISDADAGQGTFKAGTGVPVGSALGSLSIAENGNWTYNVANSAVQYLAAGDTKTESFTVAAADGTTTVITVAINGTNDLPTFTGTDVGAVTEDAAVNVDGNLVSSGALIIADADAGQSTFKAGTAVPVGTTLGSLSIAENGTWTYNVANSAVQYLAAGETKNETFTVAAADGTTTVITVTITGTNDVPTFTGTDVGAVTEDAAVNVDGNLVSSGALIITDADTGQGNFQAGTAVPVGSTLGALSIAENGTWTYNVANSAVQYLAAGETKTESFTVAAADGTTTVITVTITGTNDVPTFTGTNIGAVIEDVAINVDGNLVSSGVLIITDADTGQSTFKAGTAVPVGTTLGSLSIAENGTWIYNVANNAVQYLAAGQTKIESFTVSAADGTTTVITVTITGSNDVPTFTGSNAGAVTEDTAVNTNGNLVSSGTLMITDADAGQSTFKAGTAVAVGSTLGSLSIAANGTWTYNVANSAVQYLAAGQTKVESFTVSAADGTTTVITVTITSTNDVPTFTGSNAGAVTEDTAVNTNGNLISSGTLTINDADAGQSSFKTGTAVPVGSTLGSLSIAENGTWTYNVANSAVQYLAAGQTKVESFTVSAADGTTTVITVTITGTNDVPTFTGNNAGAVTEDTAVNTNGNLVSSGTLTINDADAGQSTFKAGTAVAVGSALGSLSIAENGTWTYNVANSAVQYLAAGQTKIESFTVSAADGTTTVITVTITGTNDVPTFTGSNAGAVTEDTAFNTNGNLVSSGTLTITDADAGQGTFKAGTAVPVGSALGSLSIKENGTWTYNVANSAVQYLAAGQTKIESFTVSAADGTTTVITVTITGTNDVPTFTGSNAGAVTEDTAVNTNGNLVSSGTLTITDADAGQSTFKAGTAVPVGSALGSLSISENGTWTYNVANSAVQYLAAGQTKVESFTVSAADGTTTVITVTITGTNDVPTFTGNNAGAVTEDTTVNTNGNLVSSGTLTITDADAGQSTFKAGTAVPVGSALGSLSIVENGTWTYNVANSAVQYLAAGQTKVESFTVSAADGTTTVITVTITGTNDVPTFTGASAGAVTEDTAVNTNGNLISSGTLTITDADAGQSTFKIGTAVPVGSTLGSLSIAENGTWTYNVANSAVQYLAAGQTKIESFTVTAADGTTTVINVTITGTNDVPTFTGASAGAVTEDTAVNTNGNLVSSGTLTITDADAGQSTFKIGTAVPVGSTIGSLSIAENGTWTYNVANSAVQYLAAGQTKIESFTVSAADGTTTVITVTITGTNDVPTFTGAAAGAVTEDTAVNTNGNLVSSGTLTITDADASQSTFKAGTAVAVGSALGSLSIAENGTWTYNVANSAVQYLAAGQTKIESFTVSAADGTTTVITVTITGTNDVPTFTGASAGAVTEDTAVNTNGNLVSSGTLNITDADAGQSTFKAATAVPVGSTLGSLSIATNGTWTYNVANSAVQHLNAGTTKTELFTVETADGTKTVITVTITGTNDAATFSGALTGTVTEDAAVTNSNLTTSGTITVVDIDAGESTFKAGAATAASGTLGSLTINAAGQWNYAVANAAVQYLGAGVTKNEVFTVQSADGTTQTITVKVVGVNDAAVIGGVTTGNVTEDSNVSNNNLSTTGKLTITDVDTGDASFQAGSGTPASGTLGSLVVNAAGEWTYTVSNAAVQYLNGNQSKDEVFTVVAKDGTTQTLTITIHGTNESSVITGVTTGTATEDGTLHAEGKLTATVSGTGTVGFNPAWITSQYGMLVVDANGKWVYDLNNSTDAVQTLRGGETRQDAFIITANDGTTQTVTITVVGTNDVANIYGTFSGTVTEDTSWNSQVSGYMSIQDRDAGEGKAFTASATTTAYGTFTMTASGQWTYTIDNTSASVQALGAGKSYVETFAIVTDDGTSRDITITISGTNDIPVIGGARTGVVTEDASVVNGNLTTAGQLTITDADAGEATFQAGSATAASGTLGSLTIGTDGKWSYSVANSAVQYLGAGVTKDEVFTLLSKDGMSQTITVKVTGVNDAAVITGSATGSVTEDSNVSNNNLNASGKLSVTDVDSGEATFRAGSATAATGTLGALTIATDGQWTYSVSNAAVQYLGAGITKNEVFTVLSVDGTLQTITVKVTGVNDGAVITGTTTGTVTEDANISSQGTLGTTGTLAVTDADTGEATFKSGAAAPVGSTLGSLSIGTSGAWTYSVANSAVQYLGVNQTKVEQFTVQSADGTAKTISITITGTNDVPMAIADTGTIGEDNTLTVTAGNGVLANDSDIDAGSTLTVSAVNNSTSNLGVAVAGSAGGTFTLKADGSYVFNPGQDFQSLTEGATKTTSVSYTVSDGQGGSALTTLTVTVTGAVDRPTISVVPHALTAAETGALTSSQGLTINYYQGVGVNDSAYKTAGNLQALVDGKTPTTTSTDGSAFDRSVGVGDVYAVKGLMFLEAGKSYTFSGYWDDTMQFKVGDTTLLNKDFNNYGTYQTVTIKPTVSGYYPLEVYMTNNDGTGRLSLIVGVDGGTASSITSGAYAIYPSVAALQAAAQDFSPMQKDAGGYNFYAVKEDQGVTGTRIELGTPTAALTDTVGPTETLKVTVSNIPVGSVLTDAAGHSITITSATQVVSLSDWSLATLKLLPPTGFIGVIALNYTAIAEGINGGTASASTTQNVFVFPLTPNAGGVKEDSGPSTLSATSTLLLRGADDQAVVFKAGSGVAATGTLGSLTIDAAGKWTYNIDNSRVQFLGANDTKLETFTVTAADNSTQTIIVTITGVNDVPTITGARTGEVTEDLNANASGNLTASGALVAADADQNQSGFVTAVTPAADALGTLSIDAAGKWSYSVANSRVQFLGAGETKVETFTVATLDGTTQTISVTIKGTNDATVFGGATTGTVTEDTNIVAGKLTTSGVLTFNDADQNQSAISTTVTPASGNLGSLTISATGAWTYSVDNSKTQYLNTDTTKIESFTVTSQDGTQQIISITLKGTNDAPILTSSSATVSEEGLSGGLKDTAGTSDTTDSTSFSGKIGIVDVDNSTFKVTLSAPTTPLTSGGLTVTWKISSDGMTLTGSTSAKDVIKVVMDATGKYSVNLLAGLDHPVKGSEDTLSFNVGVTVNDGAASATTQLGITVEDDSPIAQSSTANIFQPATTTNVLLMLDTSGSMAEKFTNTAGVTMTRLDAMKAAVTSMLDKYAELGDVRVQGVAFNSTAQGATAWMTVAQAKSFLTQLTASGGTNYDDALAKAQTAFNTSGKLAGGNNVSYFFSDGEPTMSNQVNSVNNPGNTTDPTLGDGIDTKEQAAWETFLIANKINTIAVGMGSDVGATYLNPISYDGQKSVDNNATGTVIVSNLSQLTSTVLATVPTREVTGGLGYDGTAQTGRFGGDGGSIKSLTVSGLTYTFDAAKNAVTATGTLTGGTKGTYDSTAHTLTITTAIGGKFVIDMVEGQYSYKAPVDVTNKETFTYTLTDTDGDTATSTLTINVYGASSTSAITATQGLTGEYYGYNDTKAATMGLGYRVHTDDATQGNLSSIKSVETIINGRAGVTVTGTAAATVTTATDATFVAKNLNYGGVSNDIGYNTKTTGTTAGATVAAGTSSRPSNLYAFLDNSNATDDEKSLKVNNKSELGRTTDAAIRMAGAAYFADGFYDFKITADDGYRLMIDGVAVLAYDSNTSSATKAVTGVDISAGFHTIELLYWDQGGGANMKVEFKSSDVTTYDVVSTDNMAMYTSALSLSPLQDIVQNDDGTYSLRTGQELIGSEANDVIQGTDGKDVITGGLGDDFIYGGSGDDIIDGGLGNDVLYGGTGADTLKGGEGNDVLYGNEGRDTLIGGKGDDTLFGGSGSDTFKWELSDQGTTRAPAVDTIKDFSTASVAAGGDILNLKDLLVGENDGNLSQYLNIKKDGANTVIDVSTSGNVATQVDQKIVLENVDLTSNNALTNQQIINDLLQKGKLQTDH